MPAKKHCKKEKKAWHHRAAQRAGGAAAGEGRSRRVSHEGYDGCCRRDDHDGPLAPLAHARRHGLARVNAPEVVDVDGLLKVLDILHGGGARTSAGAR